MDIIQVEEFRGLAKGLKAGAKMGKKSKSLGKVAMKGKKVAKKGIKIGKKGTKKGAKIGKKGAKKGAKIAKEGAEKSKSLAKSAADFATSDAGKKALKYGAAAAVVGGGAMYMNKKLKDKSEAIKGCVQVCLPDGYDEHVYGGKPKASLSYRTLESVKAKGAEVDEDQPFCNAEIDDCGKFCEEKCEEANPLDIPGAELAKAGAGAVGGALKGATSFAAKGIWTMIKWPVYIGCGVCLCMILVYFFMMMPKKPRAGMAAPPPPRYY